MHAVARGNVASAQGARIPGRSERAPIRAIRARDDGAFSHRDCAKGEGRRRGGEETEINRERGVCTGAHANGRR